MNDPLAFNKILAGFLCACLLLIGAGKFASFMQGSDTHHGDHHSEGDHSVSKNSYPIEVPETSISDASLVASAPVKLVPILALIASADIDAGKKLSKKCAACHSFNAGGPNKVGPNLWNVLNREMGQVEGYKYSKILSNQLIKNFAKENPNFHSISFCPGPFTSPIQDRLKESIFRKNNYNDLLNVDKIGETQVSSIKSFFSKFTKKQKIN